MKWLSVTTVVVVAAAGCSKQSDTREPTGAQVQTGAEYRAPEDESVFDDAWDAISEGGEETVEAGEWTLDKAADGAIVVWKTTKEVAGEAGDWTGDAAVHSAVKTRLAAEGMGGLDVDVDDAVVSLEGRVDSSREAAKAVRIALDTTGVERVRSKLTWPR